MKKLKVTSIKMFLREPVIEFERPDNGRSIKSISLLDDEELELTKDVIITGILPKLNGDEGKVIRKSTEPEDLATKVNKILGNYNNIDDLKEIAKEAGITLRYLNGIRKGIYTNPTLKVLRGLARALNVDVEMLV